LNQIYFFVKKVDKEAKSFVFRRGEKVDGVYVIVSGSLRQIEKDLETKREVVVAELGPGQLIGLEEILENQVVRMSSFQVVSDTVSALKEKP